MFPSLNDLFLYVRVLSLRSAWDLDSIMLGPTGESQASALGSRGLSEVHSELYLVLTS